MQQSNLYLILERLIYILVYYWMICCRIKSLLYQQYHIDNVTTRDWIILQSSHSLSFVCSKYLRSMYISDERCLPSSLLHGSTARELHQHFVINPEFSNRLLSVVWWSAGAETTGKRLKFGARTLVYCIVILPDWFRTLFNCLLINK